KSSCFGRGRMDTARIKWSFQKQCFNVFSAMEPSFRRWSIHLGHCGRRVWNRLHIYLSSNGGWLQGLVNDFIIYSSDLAVMFVFLHHGGPVHANKTNGTKEFMPVMGQKLNFQIASPNQRVFHSECLYLTRIPRFINPKFLPLVELRRIPIRDTDS